ncbi:MAG: hypothetical protein UX94_C0008G0002 [Parcubacteria group bacterium GW2011_GWA2_47_21]|nr:MAG: hypothetical protein UX94_C0008G0002 [Parcubacteria group bacterium GW2011_GWA2_47_21]
MGKTIKISIFSVLVVAAVAATTLLIAPFSATAQVPDYVPLSPLPKTVTSDDCIANPTTCTTNLTKYVTGGFQLAILIAGVLAVLTLAAAGIQYMTTDSIPSKGSAKEKIQNAVLGLLLALGAYLILITINPELLNLRLLEDLNRINARLADLRSVQFLQLPINGLLAEYYNSIKVNGDAFRQSRTDEADLAKKVEELQKQLAAETDPAKKADLEKQITEAELARHVVSEEVKIRFIMTTFPSFSQKATENVRYAFDGIVSARSTTSVNLSAISAIQDELKKNYEMLKGKGGPGYYGLETIQTLGDPGLISLIQDARTQLDTSFNKFNSCIEAQKTCARDNHIITIGIDITKFNTCVSAIPKTTCQ